MPWKVSRPFSLTDFFFLSFSPRRFEWNWVAFSDS